MLPAHLSRGVRAVAWDDPVFIGGPLTVQEGLAQILHRGEILHLEEVFLEDADKALDAAVAFRGPDKGRRTGEAQKGEFFLEILRPIQTAVVVSKGQAWGRPWRRVPEVVSDPLSDRFQSLDPVPRVPAWIPIHSREQ